MSEKFGPAAETAELIYNLAHANRSKEEKLQAIAAIIAGDRATQRQLCAAAALVATGEVGRQKAAVTGEKR